MKPQSGPRTAIAIWVISLVAAQLAADDWPGWRGPRRDGVSRETGWLDAWSAGEVVCLLAGKLQK